MGRFQDADESAYYEYICKRAGTPVKYCNEQFDNDGSPVATIVKASNGQWRPNIAVNFLVKSLPESAA